METPVNPQPLIIDIKVGDNGLLPRKAYATDAAADLYASTDICILKGETVRVPTDIRIKLPQGFLGLVLPRSSMRVLGMVCMSVWDSNYTGEMSILVTNAGNEPIRIAKGERFAQLLCFPIVPYTFQQVTELVAEPTERGTRGIGSTGQF